MINGIRPSFTGFIDVRGHLINTDHIAHAEDCYALGEPYVDLTLADGSKVKIRNIGSYRFSQLMTKALQNPDKIITELDLEA
ncbi:MAG: hypothetical protein NC191_08660 [Muribaculaceae bacterium]|nr:hypothetical protein [Muribaculaceae bacterium]